MKTDTLQLNERSQMLNECPVFDGGAIGTSTGVSNFSQLKNLRIKIIDSDITNDELIVKLNSMQQKPGITCQSVSEVRKYLKKIAS